MSVKPIILELARAKSYFHRHEVLRSIMSVATALKAMVKTQAMGQDRQIIEGALRELVQHLNRTDEVKRYCPKGALTWERGGAKRLFSELAQTLKAIKEESERETIEATRERKLKLDQLLVRGQKSLEYKKLAEAEEAFQEAITLYVDEHKLFYMIGSRLLAADFSKPAIKYLQKGAEVDPDADSIYFFLAKAYAGQSEFDKAEASLIKAQELFGEDADRLGLLSQILLHQKKTREAFTAARRSLELDPMQAEAKKVFTRIKNAARPKPSEPAAS